MSSWADRRQILEDVWNKIFSNDLESWPTVNEKDWNDILITLGINLTEKERIDLFQLINENGISDRLDGLLATVIRFTILGKIQKFHSYYYKILIKIILQITKIIFHVFINGDYQNINHQISNYYFMDIFAKNYLIYLYPLMLSIFAFIIISITPC